MIDGLLLVGFGAPESVADVWPFLERIAQGRGIPVERLRSVATHYEHLGGSPLNAQNEAMLAALTARLEARGITIATALGHRNTPPFIGDAVAELEQQGCRDILAFFATPWASYSSCRQYREDLGQVETVAKVRHLPPYADLPGIVDAVTAVVTTALADADDPYVVFTTHSLPLAEGPGDDPERYVRQHEETCAAVAARLGLSRWSLAYQSRSGRPDQPWLEPDINDELERLAQLGERDVLLVPVGFLTEHVEVLWDLDSEAVATAQRLGQRLRRTATIGQRDEFLDDLAERLAHAITGSFRPSTCDGLCTSTCCPNPRGARPAS
ncbi:MAG: ferrochelatase, partial [Propionibacteriaceae bacterium]